LSVHRSGCPLGSHAWMLIAMFHLAMDLASCEPAGGWLSPRPAHRHRLPRGALWANAAWPAWPWGDGSCRDPAAPCFPSGRKWQEGADPERGPPRPFVVVRKRPTASRSTGPGVAGLLAVRTWKPTRRASPAPLRCASGATAGSALRGQRRRGRGWRAFAERASAGHPDGGRLVLARPGRVAGTPGGCLAVHQIITITVSLIMVIAALITTLVLKNCCAQSGNTRRNSHQRKINQQEESCQNLTDFTPARVPSSLDIFTAYNETLQCSHECVRTPVSVYAEEALHSPGDYKATFNGNRPSSSDRHLIPVAFVSEKWFEISC
ncbi:AJAP1 protein, partial [Chauna torquata]|nr:AJAP1 protein [Chauna torquata]